MPPITLEQLRTELTKDIGPAVTASMKQELPAIVAELYGKQAGKDGQAGQSGQSGDGAVDYAAVHKAAEMGLLLRPDGTKIGPEEVAELQRGIGAIGRGIPWQPALVGGAGALVTTEVINAVAGRFGGGDGMFGGDLWAAVLKLLSAWGLVAWGRGVLGQEASRFGAGFIIFSAVSDLFQLDTMIKNLFGGFLGERGRGSGSYYGLQSGFAEANLPALPAGFGQVVPGQGGVGVDKFAGIYSY